MESITLKFDMPGDIVDIVARAMMAFDPNEFNMIAETLTTMGAKKGATKEQWLMSILVMLGEETFWQCVETFRETHTICPQCATVTKIVSVCDEQAYIECKCGNTGYVPMYQKDKS